MADLELESLDNGDGNNYLLRDNTKIPLSGSNQISGDLIPSSDGTVNLGSTSYNFENINTKFLSSSDDLTLYSSFNGNTTGSFLTLKKIDSTSESGSFQLNAHTETQIAQLIGYPDGTLTWRNKEIDTIEEQGDGYIRYSNGLQICYGSVINSNNIATGTSRHSYPVAFSAIPNVVATPNAPSQSGPHLVTVIAESETNFIVNLWWTQASQLSSSAIKSHYVAIGKWK